MPLASKHIARKMRRTKNMPKERKFKKDFTPKQYLAYLERKAKKPNALIEEDRQGETRNTK